MATKLTPMMQQYMSVKERYPEELLFFRMGDFYEMFFTDAETASRELNITLTGRAAGNNDKVPMCGVPYHAAEGYILKLIEKGYKVAICEQVEDPKEAKGIVKRDVIRVITPGTVLSENGTAASDNNFLALFHQYKEHTAMLFADVSTGEIIWLDHEKGQMAGDIIDQLAMYRPREIILVSETALPKAVKQYVENHMDGTVFTQFTANALPLHLLDALKEEALLSVGKEHFSMYCDVKEPVWMALGALYLYLKEVIKVQPDHMTFIHAFDMQNRLFLDASSLRHLEITRNLRDGGTKGTLFSVLNETKTPMGNRLLKQWVENPLLHIPDIEKRQEAVGEMMDSLSLRDGLGEYLKSIFDFERILTRVETGSVSPKDLVALRESLRILPSVKALLRKCQSSTLQKVEGSIHEHGDMYVLLEKGIAESPALTLKEGGVIADGYHAELDELRSLATNSQAWLTRLEDEIKEKTGLRLKTGYNKVFGYYFEVSRLQSENVPEYFIRKQTLANAERYITPELKEFEIKMLSAKDRIIALEQQLFAEIRTALRNEIRSIQETARAIAEVDVYRSLGQVAYIGRYTRPSLNQRGRIYIKDGRHPVIEKFLQQEVYVPNDVELNHDEEECILITGPNMAGKSTYMRQVAILMIMAQMGAFIPAAEANISPVDRVFTRVGASDDISTGQSTFMVEMKEVAYILDNATKDSLIILDEIGRGTSTFDGLSIARAVVEYIAKQIGAKTLFATHYHELIALEDEFPKVKNYTVAVKERGHDVVFLRRIIKGGADRSYGIHVAKLAGLPEKVLKRANTILEHLEQEAPEERIAVPTVKVVQEEPTMDLFTHSVVDELKALDIMTMTPIEALNVLYKLQEEARDGEGK